jgi:hypothetical protein
MQIETNKDKGRIGLSLAIAYFGTNGYTVSLPLNDTQWYDLVVEKDNIFETVQCKCTTTLDGVIDFTSKGGTKGTRYDSILDHPLDYIFCVNKDGLMWLIPVEEIRKSGNTKSISLRTQPNANNQGFNSYKYLVQF